MTKTKKLKYIAKTLYGLEEVLAVELTQLGATNLKQVNRAIHFEADLKTLYKINLASRAALRIIYPIKEFYAKTPNQLYTASKQFNWSNILTSEDTFAIDSVVHSNNFRHSKYAALKVKDAIADYFREKFGKRPSVDIVDPTVRINLHIENEHCTISLDSSGESLHRRGYRLKGETAPLNEVLAAGLILISGWDQNSNLVDPMCGSGTIVIEAALMALNIPPNLKRNKFGFMNWKSFDNELYESLKTELMSQRKNIDFTIMGNDINKNSIWAAKANAKKADLGNIIKFSNYDFFNAENNLESGTIITNPPYGERLKQTDMDNFYKQIGDTLKNNFNNFNSWILSSNKEALKRLGLRTSRRLLLYNGSLECKFHNYKLYKGSLKKKYE